ncbi:MAG: triple tyrosine motif-containing protein, partial [Bacteroidota bacterium]
MVFVITVCGGQQVVRQGKPFVRNFLPSDYNDHPQNWAITQGDDGLIYFANNNGVIEYDGNEFRKVSLNDVRSFGKDKTGKIYVGAENQLGFLYHDSLGQLKFKSLVEKIPEPYRKFYTILSIIHVGDEMYCFGFRSILVFKDDEFIRAWQAETDFRFGFYVYNRMFVRQSGIGLMELKNDSLMLIPGGEKFANQSVYFMLPHKDGRILMGTRSEGLYLMTNDENLKLEKFQTKFDDYLVQNTLYHGLKITDDLYVLVTNYGGVILMDSQGTLLQLFNRSSGMASNSMNYAYLDNMNNLWLASNNGIYYIELNTPITWFDEETGLKDLGVTINRIGEQLFIGTMENLFRFERNDFLGALSDRFYGFKPVEGSVDSYMDIIQFNGKLICANRSGIFEMVDNRPVLLDTSFFNYILCPSKLEKNVLFVGNGQGILKLLYFPEDNEWMSFGNFISTDGDVRDIIELDSGDLLFVEKSKHFYHARKTEHGYDILRIDSVNGLPLKEPVSMSRLYEKVILTTRGANYFYDLEKGELMSFNDLPVIIHGDTLSLGRFHTVDEKNFWVMTDKGIAKVKNGDSLELDFLPFLRIPESDPFDIYDDTSESCLWVATPKGVFCYNYMNSRDYYASFPTYLRKVVFGTDSVVSFYVTDSLYHAVDYMYNSVSFVFTSGFYESSESNEYTYFLEGFDKEWSRWSNENKATYTNLSPGEYIFTVRSRNCYKVEGEITRYSFRIIAPWYMTWWAYIIYFLLLAVLIYLIVYFNSRRLLRINEKLERIIEQRTVEINRKNSELEKQNKLITDSIRYAKHIQEAILPNADVLKKYFPDSFVYFLPRDIV